MIKKKTSFKIIHMKLLFIACCFAASSASAQIERKPVVIKADSAQATASPAAADKQTRRERFKELDLTREQKLKLRDMMQSGKSAKEGIENNTQLSADEKKKQLRELKKAQALKIQAILTPEQREKFKASKEED